MLLRYVCIHLSLVIYVGYEELVDAICEPLTTISSTKTIGRRTLTPVQDCTIMCESDNSGRSDEIESEHTMLREQSAAAL